MQNPFQRWKKREWVLWFFSAVVVLSSNIATGNVDLLSLSSTMIGITALIFVARGDVWGQVLSVIFSILYALISYRFRYYGEMITYLGMSLPAAAISVVTWLKHPYQKNEVKIHRLKKQEFLLMILSGILVTILFYFVLKWLNTANLIVSTISVTTSFLASFLVMYRSPFYALVYGLNDIVLIVLWVLASIEDIYYLPMVACFAVFLVNDLYAFSSWKHRQIKQRAGN